MDCSTPGFPVHHQTPRACSDSCPLSQWCHSTISSSVIPLSSCLQSFPASRSFPMSQFFSHQVAKVLEFQLEHQSFQWIFRTLSLTGLISLLSKELSRVFSNPTVQKLQFFSAQPLQSNSHIRTWLLEKTITQVLMKNLLSPVKPYTCDLDLSKTEIIQGLLWL